jgi:glyoxylase-like metal-dependent hydrolase (beta-lactamase superfamily II)
MQTIIPNLLHTFDGLIVGRVYLIEDADGLTLIDASISGAAPKIKRQIEAYGRKIEDVKRILITHAHMDHVGALPQLSAWTRAQVIASAPERPVIEGEQPVMRADPAALSGVQKLMRSPETWFKRVQVDRVVGDGDVIAEVMGGLHVVAAPGHAPGHLAFWSPLHKVLFIGDVIMPRLGKLRLPFATFTPDPAENLRSVAKLIRFDAEIACFGHSPPITAQASAAIRSFARQVGAV